MTTTDNKLNSLLLTASPNEILLFQALYQIANLNSEQEDNNEGEDRAKQLATAAIDMFFAI